MNLNRNKRSIINCDGRVARRVLELCAVEEINNIAIDEEKILLALNSSLSSIRSEFETEMSLHHITVAIFKTLCTSDACKQLVDKYENTLVSLNSEMENTWHDLQNINSLAETVDQHTTPLHVPLPPSPEPVPDHNSIFIITSFVLSLISISLHLIYMRTTCNRTRKTILTTTTVPMIENSHSPACDALNL